MRFDLMALPDPIDSGFAHAMFLGHRATTPMRGPGRLAPQSALDDSRHLCHRIGWFSSTTRSDFPQAVGALLTEARPPKRDGLEIDLQVFSNLLVLASVARRQNDATALRHLLRSCVGSNPSFQFKTVRRPQGNWLSNTWHGARVYLKIYNSIHL